jgi:hypothetical protein
MKIELVYAIAAGGLIIASFIAIINFSPPRSLSFLQDVWWLHVVGLALCGYIIRGADRRMHTAREDAYKMARAASMAKRLVS